MVKLRHLIKRIPGARWLHYNSRLLLAPTFSEDGLRTIHRADFTRDRQFQSAWHAAERRQPGTHMRWRMHVTQWAAWQALQLPGDFVECGVNRGYLAASIVDYVDFVSQKERKFYLFDTFQGLVPELVSVRDKAAHLNEYQDVYDDVVKAFGACPNVIPVRGAVPESLSSVDIDRVAYLSIDMNCAEPERDAMEYFWPRLSSGALIVLDDYGFAGHEYQKELADQFADQRDLQVLALPTGQGLLIKA
jgi:hypothetical protein